MQPGSTPSARYTPNRLGASHYCSSFSCPHKIVFLSVFFFNDTATTEIYTLSLHDALPIWNSSCGSRSSFGRTSLGSGALTMRSEEHTSELQSLRHLVCRLLLEKKKTT